MRKNGFTFVELLGVIILIGLLIVLIVSRVRPAIDDSKEAVSEASVNMLVSALEDYYFEAKLKGGFTGCSYDFDSEVNTCSGFSFTGDKPTGGVLNLSVDGVVSGSILMDNTYTYNIIKNKISNN